MDDQNTSQMQDEVPTENSTVDATTNVEDSTKDEVAQEAEATEATVEDTTEQEQTVEPPVSHRENKRIADLTRQLAESNTLRQRTQQPTANQPIIGEGDYDIAQVNNMAQEYGDKRYGEGLEFAKSVTFQNRLEIDAPKVEAKYAILDPRNESEFDPGIADLTTQMYYSAVGLKARGDGTFTVDNPNIRYSDYVDAFMGAAERIATVKFADSQKNITKQAAQAGVRPGNQSKQVYSGGDPKKMTTDQLSKLVGSQLGI